MQPQESFFGEILSLLWAHVRADVYVLFHWDCEFYMEDRDISLRSGGWAIQTTFIGVVNEQGYVTRAYYGAPERRVFHSADNIDGEE